MFLFPEGNVFDFPMEKPVAEVDDNADANIIYLLCCSINPPGGGGGGKLGRG